jgi:hypothetical protein
VFSLLWATLLYDPLAHWVWGVGGFLRNMGALDFAGGTVVHISAGASALVAVLIMGKRVGFGKVPMAPHNLPFAVIGAAMLWVGWFGFNAGSALGANGLASSAFMATHTCCFPGSARLDGCGMAQDRQTDHARRSFRSSRGARRDYAGIRFRHADGRHCDWFWRRRGLLYRLYVEAEVRL